ncbi:MAG TPA: hypothetical protein QGF02_01095 [Candidatus Babeliales bacterium]|nr:hypothetical protein [Candidatus Babeliales bacterium]
MKKLMGLLLLVFAIKMEAKQLELKQLELSIENATQMPYTMSIYPAHKGAPHPIHYPVAELSESILSKKTLSHGTDHLGQFLVLVQRTNVPYSEAMPFLFTVQQPGRYVLKMDKRGNLMLDTKTSVGTVISGIRV